MDDLSGLSAGALAEKFGINAYTLRQWITGRCRPNYTTLSGLSDDDRRSLIAEVDRRRKVRRELKEALKDG